MAGKKAADFLGIQKIAKLTVMLMRSVNHIYLKE